MDGNPGCKWFDGASVTCEPATAESAWQCTALLSGVAAGAEPSTCEPSITAGCAWLAAEPEATACEPVSTVHWYMYTRNQAGPCNSV